MTADPGLRGPDAGPAGIDAGEYCRQLEAYLCRKNDGHLIRIVGPAFERVCGWAEQGVPLRIAFAGVDRYFDRYYARGPRRRPVRIEFCEADVLDVFDEWRRAVGIWREPAAAAAGDAGREEQAPRRRVGLAMHLDRVIARLAALRGVASVDRPAGRALDLLIDRMVRELDGERAAARSARGPARERILARLAALDADLLDAARAVCEPGTLAALDRDASGELQGFRQRMLPETYREAHSRAVDRLVREHLALPTLTF